VTGTSLAYAKTSSTDVHRREVLGGVDRPAALMALGAPKTTSTTAVGALVTARNTRAEEPSSAAFVSPIARTPKPARLDRCIVLQKWEGRVEDVSVDSFVATLTDTLGSGPTEVAEFALDELSPFDLPLVLPGAIFYWNLGYRIAAGGQRSRESVIRFRRMPRWSAQDRAEAARRADRWRTQLGWND
jgi:hypothetical protein